MNCYQTERLKTVSRLIRSLEEILIPDIRKTIARLQEQLQKDTLHLSELKEEFVRLQQEENNMIPNSLTKWINSLPSRPGWGQWKNVGCSVYDGVQCWSENETPKGAVGVWGIAHWQTWEEWSVHIDNDINPVRANFPSAETAMAWAEQTFPEMF